MKNKNERLAAIQRLIGKKKISSQEELLRMLIAEGFKMTQATLSRDLHYLKVSKMPDADDTYIYVLKETVVPVQKGLNVGFPLNGFISMQFVMGMAIIRTLPGFASGIASAIDTMKIREIAGTIAGDDTILLIPIDVSAKDEIIRKLSRIIPGMKTKLI
jgi:transcriptional regulator of arginine metabolism